MKDKSLRLKQSIKIESGKQTMKAAIIFLIIFMQVLPASAADSSTEGVAGTAHIAGLYSNLESFDVTLYSEKFSGIVQQDRLSYYQVRTIFFILKHYINFSTFS